jgi:hypothetical protein
MMADFAAHSEYIMEKRSIDTGLPRNRTTAAVPKGMTPSTHIQFTPEMLRKVRADIIERATPKKGPNARHGLDEAPSAMTATYAVAQKEQPRTARGRERGLEREVGGERGLIGASRPTSQSDVGNGWEADLNLPPGRWTSAISEMGGTQTCSAAMWARQSGEQRLGEASSRPAVELLHRLRLLRRWSGGPAVVADA